AVPPTSARSSSPCAGGPAPACSCSRIGRVRDASFSRRYSTTRTGARSARARAAADAGDAALRFFVERTIDIENLQSALALSSQASDVPPGRLFVDGGSIVTVGDLAAARGAGSAIDLAARLAPRVRGTPLAAMLNHGTRSAEDAALDALADEFRRRARDAPLSLAPVILFALRQRAELHMLLRILWGVSLGVPRATVERMAGIAA